MVQIWVLLAQKKAAGLLKTNGPVLKKPADGGGISAGLG